MGLIDVCIYLVLIGLATAHSSGAGSAACTDLTLQPGHGGSSQDLQQSPYTVTANATEYAPNDVIEEKEEKTTTSGGFVSRICAADVILKIEGSESFKGFLLVASTIGGTTTIGTFSAAPPTLTSFVKEQCTSNNGSGLTHQSMFNSNGVGRDSVVTHWRAPAAGVGSVRFYATAVKTQMVYYQKIEGPMLTESVSPGNSTASDASTTASGGSSSDSTQVQDNTTPNSATTIHLSFMTGCLAISSILILMQ